MEEPRSFRLPLQSNIAKISVEPASSIPPQAQLVSDPAMPSVMLVIEPFGQGKRTAAQQAAIDAVAASAGADLFGDDLQTAYWKVSLQPAHGGLQLRYLFNVVVALEWTPSASYMRKLHQGLRWASDLLYDVTDGQMAFGKVTIADASWMDCADIQIMASNRILPRSWTGGLIETAKYAPVRAGRGVWVRDRHEVQDWDTANAYHTLIHEWLHYALFLRDEYLTEAQPYKLAGTGKRAQKYHLVLPIGGLGVPSIMSTPVGHSELSRQSLSNPDQASIDQAYPGLTIGAGQADPGPYRLPLPLPVFQLAGNFKAMAYLQEVLDTAEYLLLGSVNDASREEQKLVLGAGVAIGLPQGGPDFLEAWRAKARQGRGGNGARQPLTFEAESALHISWEAAVLRAGGAQIVAQGTLDAGALRPKPSEFTLCGTGVGDDVVIIGGGTACKVFRGTVAATGASVTEDTNVPAERPLVDVFPAGNPNDFPREVDVRAEATGPQRAAWTTQPFPRGKLGTALAALDGQVLLTHNGGYGNLVCSYSRGGVAPSGVSSPTNPLAAGSSDGGAMIFGHADKGVVSQQYLEAINRTVVITTSIPWLPTDTPTIRVKIKRGEGYSDVTAGVRRLSNVFSITSSSTLKGLDEQFAYARGRKRPADQDRLNPTLTMLFEPAAVDEGERVILCRQDESLGANVWVPLMTRQAGQVTCSTPLNAETAPGLYNGGVADRYCLFALKPPAGMVSVSLEPC